MGIAIFSVSEVPNSKADFDPNTIADLTVNADSKNSTTEPSSQKLSQNHELEAAQAVREGALHDLMKSMFWVLFIVLLVIQIDTPFNTNWWFIFLPLWIMTFLIYTINFQRFAEVQCMAAEKDPELFGSSDDGDNDEETGSGISSNETTMNIALGGDSGSNTNYGSVGRDGVVTNYTILGVLGFNSYRIIGDYVVL